jgi:hypothetical protein
MDMKARLLFLFILLSPSRCFPSSFASRSSICEAVPTHVGVMVATKTNTQRRTEYKSAKKKKHDDAAADYLATELSLKGNRKNNYVVTTPKTNKEKNSGKEGKAPSHIYHCVFLQSCIVVSTLTQQGEGGRSEKGNMKKRKRRRRRRCRWFITGHMFLPPSGITRSR